MTTETEIKLIFEGRALARLAKTETLLAAAEGPVRRRRLKSVYFDTDDRLLFRRGHTLRIRQDGTRFTQTVKAEATSDAEMASRPEWESPVAGPDPDLDRAADTPVPDILAGKERTAADLKPLVLVEVSRTLRLLRPDPQTLIEMAIDRGRITAGEQTEAVAEVELELKEGEPAALFAFARRLLHEVPFRLEFRAKSARGFALLDGTPGAERATAVELDDTASIETAFKHIAGSCLRQMAANEAPALSGKDPEGVHQLRVGLRRLRSAVSLFGKALPPGPFGPLRGRLRDLMAAFGPAREWDVLIDETLAPLGTRVGQDPGLAQLEKLARAARLDGHRRLRQAIAAPEHTDLKLTLLELLAADWSHYAERPAPPDWRQPPWTRPIGPFADGMLERRHRRLRKFGRTHQAMTLEELHELRIAAKKLRYAAEFFRQLYRKRRVRTYTAALAGVQDCLGAINDGAVGRARIAEAWERLGGLSRRSPRRARAEGAVEGWFAAVEHVELSAFAKAWQRFLDARRFWRKPTTAA